MQFLSLGLFATFRGAAPPKESKTDLWSKRLVEVVKADLHSPRYGNSPPEITKKSSLDLFDLRFPKGLYVNIFASG